jgi:hypothetical protein
MRRVAFLVLLLAICAEVQPRAICVTAATAPDSPPHSNSQTKPRFRSRRAWIIAGIALAGAGAALLATSGRTRRVPAANCDSSAAMVLIPCIPAHTEQTRSSAQDAAAGSLLLGGIVTIYSTMR